MIGVDFLPFLANIACKIFPNNLTVLKIERCQISREATLGIVRFLRDQSYVRVVSLVRVSFDAESIGVMCQYLTTKPYVEELDLSDNRLEPRVFRPLLVALTKHRSLKSLNLAWNALLERSQGAQIGTYVQEEKLVFGLANQATMEALIQTDGAQD